jgi:large subunit ribosomal protein L29
MISAQEMRKLSPEERSRKVLEWRREALALRMQRGSGELASPSQFSKLRRSVARAKTIAHESARHAGQAGVR